MEVGGAGKLYRLRKPRRTLWPRAPADRGQRTSRKFGFLDTIPMPKGYTGEKIKQLTVADMFAEAITRIDEETSISSLF